MELREEDDQKMDVVKIEMQSPERNGNRIKDEKKGKKKMAANKWTERNKSRWGGLLQHDIEKECLAHSSQV